MKTWEKAEGKPTQYVKSKHQSREHDLDQDQGDEGAIQDEANTFIRTVQWTHLHQKIVITIVSGVSHTILFSRGISTGVYTGGIQEMA